jgi:hypothetical protein
MLQADHVRTPSIRHQLVEAPPPATDEASLAGMTQLPITAPPPAQWAIDVDDGFTRTAAFCLSIFCDFTPPRAVRQHDRADHRDQQDNARRFEQEEVRV